MKKLIFSLSVAILACVSSCKKAVPNPYESYILVASYKHVVEHSYSQTPLYDTYYQYQLLGKDNQPVNDIWFLRGSIDGFEDVYEEGYEYVIKVLIEYYSPPEWSIEQIPTRHFIFRSIISKEKKDTGPIEQFFFDVN